MQTYETFENKIIVNVYPKKSNFGMGDYMRGIINLYQKEKWNCIYINYNNNKLSKYLYNDTNTNYETNLKPITIADDFMSHNGINIIHHNGAIQYPIDEKILIQVRKMFTMKPEFKEYFMQKMNEQQLYKNDFIVLHIRYDDDVFNNDGDKSNKTLEKTIQQLVSKYKNILILSNSKMMKEHLALKYKLKYFDIIPTHTGLYQDSDDDNIRDTLLEFFSMTYSKKIYQYCEDKNQISGFSKRINEIYNIPLEIIH